MLGTEAKLALLTLAFSLYFQWALLGSLIGFGILILTLNVFFHQDKGKVQKKNQ